MVQKLADVQNAVIADSEHLSFSFTGGRKLAGELLAFLQTNGVKVRWFTENEASLENVFIDITSRDGGKAE